MNALFIGYDLLGFIDGTKKCPAADHADFTYWTRQDQLILLAIISYVDHSIVTMLGNVKNSKQAWDTLKNMYASKTRARIMHLKERLSRFTKGATTMTEYLHGIKAISDELAIINSPLDDVDLVIHTLNGLGSEYRDITTAVRTRENPVSMIFSQTLRIISNEMDTLLISQISLLLPQQMQHLRENLKATNVDLLMGTQTSFAPLLLLILEGSYVNTVRNPDTQPKFATNFMAIQSVLRLLLPVPIMQPLHLVPLQMAGSWTRELLIISQMHLTIYTLLVPIMVMTNF